MARFFPKKRQIFIGIDQTGAVLSSGKPKPLEAIVLADGKLTPIRLPSLTASSLLQTLRWEIIPPTLTIIADCVLGLPEGVRPTFVNALSAAGDHPGFGRKSAQQFFSGFKKQEALPRRAVEVLCKANSVFQTHPFQKNIQTGTFRIWKDLASEPNWFYLPILGLGNRKFGTPIFEGYPTFSWKKLFPVTHREPSRLPELIKEHFPEIKLSETVACRLSRNANLADATVLALSGWRWLGARKPLIPRHTKARAEGWILGAGVDEG